MKQKRKYRKRRVPETVKKRIAQDIAAEIHELIDSLANDYNNTLLVIRADLIRARARIKERQHDESGI